MADKGSALALISEVQTKNSTLKSEGLRSAAFQVAKWALANSQAVMAVDATGERILGAALLLDNRVRPVDSSRRLDGASVLLVSGYAAGSARIAQQAALARSLGAWRVDVIGLGNFDVTATGCDNASQVLDGTLAVAL